MEVPDKAAINQHRLDRLRQRLTSTLDEPRANEEERALLAEILQRVAGEKGCTADQLALAALELSLAGKPLLLQGHDDWQPMRERPRAGERSRDRDGERGSDRPQRPPSAPEENMERFRIELGWRDRIKPGNIVGAIANEAGLDGRRIGRIQIFDTHSTVDLPKGMPDDVFQDLRNLRIMNKDLQISRLG
jgi:ATP-dependent RNA helicase DeaD